MHFLVIENLASNWEFVFIRNHSQTHFIHDQFLMEYCLYSWPHQSICCKLRFFTTSNPWCRWCAYLHSITTWTGDSQQQYNIARRVWGLPDEEQIKENNWAFLFAAITENGTWNLSSMEESTILKKKKKYNIAMHLNWIFSNILLLIKTKLVSCKCFIFWICN